MDHEPIDRREFLRRAAWTTAASTAAITSLTNAARPGHAGAARRPAANPTTTSTVPAAVRNGQLIVATDVAEPVADPAMASTDGARLLTGLLGDYLAVANADYTLEPSLALRWTPNTQATTWAFVVRPGITFHDGSPLDADAVIATFRRLLDPASPTPAGAVLRGLLSPAGLERVGPMIVRFHLDAPSGTFPFLVSSENPGAVITPARFVPGATPWFPGTGSWRVAPGSAAPGSAGAPGDGRVTLVPFNGWRRRPATVKQIVLVPGLAPDAAMAQIVSGQIDVVASVPPASASGLASTVRIQATPTTAHAQIHLRVDAGALASQPLREAFALSVDRPLLLRTRLHSHGDLGNDVPLPPTFPVGRTGVAQRARNVARAQALIGTTGRRSVDLNVALPNDPSAAALLAAITPMAADAKIRLVAQPSDAYYESVWLNSDCGITRYAHRADLVGLVGATLSTDGAWNAAHYAVPEVDTLARTLGTALDLEAQRTAARALTARLLRDTPMIVPYFEHHLAALGARFPAVRVSAFGQLDLRALP